MKNVSASNQKDLTWLLEEDDEEHTSQQHGSFRFDEVRCRRKRRSLQFRLTPKFVQIYGLVLVDEAVLHCSTGIGSRPLSSMRTVFRLTPSSKIFTLFFHAVVCYAFYAFLNVKKSYITDERLK